MGRLIPSTSTSPSQRNGSRGEGDIAASTPNLKGEELSKCTSAGRKAGWAQPLSACSGTGVFVGYASLFGVRDAAGDMVMPGAFAASLKNRGVRKHPHAVPA